MAYDEGLAERIRATIGPRPDVGEIKMFGGLCFTTNGNMFAGISRSDLMVRINKADYQALLSKPGARPMEFTGRAMTSMLFVAPEAIEQDDALSSWLHEAYGYASTLPAKRPKAKAPAKSKK